jgi:DNA-binding beta-propeller fold protein YncE
MISEDNWTRGTIRSFAGTSIAGYFGDGGKAETAQLNGPVGLAVDKGNNIFVAEMHNNIIRRIDARTGVISTVAGTGSNGFEGDGGLAIHAKLNGPLGVYVDVGGTIFIADSFNHRIRKVDAQSGIITTIAGTGTPGYSGDGFNACDSQLNFPAGVIADYSGSLYFKNPYLHNVVFPLYCNMKYCVLGEYQWLNLKVKNHVRQPLGRVVTI